LQGTKPASSYIPGLDGIRAIAFLLVFWAHGTPGPISHYIPATLGVTIFFFLSGYLITTLLRKEVTRTGTISLRDFYLRRTIRILVPLYIVYAISVPFAHYLLHTFAGNLRGALSVVFYYYNYSIFLNWNCLPPVGMDVVWSLCVEEHFYILFPLLYLTMMRRRISTQRQTQFLLLLCGLELVWRFVLLLVLHKNWMWTYAATDARFDSILWGCILALRNNPVLTSATGRSAGWSGKPFATSAGSPTSSTSATSYFWMRWNYTFLTVSGSARRSVSSWRLPSPA
jgi:peptidoglycan/LPS O-acetylase OafA/YrhL